jgi:hypothetical protein
MKPDIIARIRLLPTSLGGRRGVTPADHLGCILVFGREHFECRLLLQDIGPLAPGAKASVPIKFLDPHAVSCLSVGSQFELREVQTIGEGVVESIADR